MFLPKKTRKQHFWSLFLFPITAKIPKREQKSSKRRLGGREGGMLQQTNRKGKEEGGGKKSRQFPLPPQKRERDRFAYRSFLSPPRQEGKGNVEKKKIPWEGKEEKRKRRQFKCCPTVDPPTTTTTAVRCQLERRGGCWELLPLRFGSGWQPKRETVGGGGGGEKRSQWRGRHLLRD